MSSLFKAYLEVEQQDETTYVVRAHRSAVFSNWIAFRRQLAEIGVKQKHNIVLDLTNTKLVDHSVKSKLHELQRDFDRTGLSLEITGLDGHVSLAKHHHAARKRPRRRKQA